MVAIHMCIERQSAQRAATTVTPATLTEFFEVFTGALKPKRQVFWVGVVADM